ncbi:MAG: hypothetical protein QM778_00285 [Myxococcales bacterium]
MPDEHLKDYLARATTSRDAAGGDDGPVLPTASDAYKAYAKRAQPVYTLHCLLGATGCRSFQYADLDSDSRFTIDRRGQAIALRFVGSKTTTVLIRGRNLREIYDYIHQHKTLWVMQLDAERDFLDGKEPVITAIEFPEADERDEPMPAHGPAKVLEMN